MSCRKVKSGGDKWLLLSASSARSIIWWTAGNRTGCQALIKIEMNWAADNSLRQSNSVIFSFEGYNLIVSQGGRLTQGALRALPLPFVCWEITLVYLLSSQVCLALGCHSHKRQLAVTAVPRTYLPGNFVSFRVMLKGDWEVSSLIKFSKSCGFGRPFFKCPCSWRTPHLEGKQRYSLAFKKGLK